MSVPGNSVVLGMTAENQFAIYSRQELSFTYQGQNWDTFCMLAWKTHYFCTYFAIFFFNKNILNFTNWSNTKYIITELKFNYSVKTEK